MDLVFNGYYGFRGSFSLETRQYPLLTWAASSNITTLDKL